MQTTADIKNAGLFGVITPTLSPDEAIDLTHVLQNGPRCPKGPKQSIDLTNVEPIDVANLDLDNPEDARTLKALVLRAKGYLADHPSITGAVTALAMVGVTVMPAAADANLTIDWSGIGSIFTGLGTYVFPAIGQMVIGIVPTLIILAIVGFVMKFLDRILAMISFHI